ncbi:MAG TPA: hypothetical protein PLR88_08535 [Bacteroidales bacterium]|nr:hypothetical protein [Bacteroidales bacterium]HPT21975.1 hypothetical protein [Bacteroidales bacterium]
MKNTIFLSAILLVLLSSGLTSCEKEKSADELIIGTWKVQDYTSILYIGGIKSESHTYFLNTDELSFEFLEGGSGIEYQDGEMYQVFEWTIENSSLVMTYGKIVQNWSFTVDEGTLTFTATGSGTMDDGTAYTYDVIYTATR